MTDVHKTSVLIVGGALTGLSGAVLLAAHGVPCMVVERHPDLLLHPRLRGINQRSMEIFRQVGLEPAIRGACYADAETFQWRPVQAETLNGEHRLVEESEDGDGLAAASPAPAGPIDQDRLELVLRARARELGADVRYSTELVALSEHESGVRAVLRHRESGGTFEVDAEYLIAADGAESPIRAGLGIEVHGPGMLYHTITAIVDADLRPALRGRQVGIAYLQRPQPFTILMGHDRAGTQWVFGTGYDPTRESADDFGDARIAEMVRAAAGLPDVDVTVKAQIPGTQTKVLAFGIGAQVAASFRSRHGRVFLAGDAARINPPTGGLGGNTGIQDVHNLAWKLAAVLRGTAGPELLDTYAAERRPVAVLTMEQALARFGSRMGPGSRIELLAYDSVAMGYRYRSPAVLGAPADTTPVRPLELSGAPGTRAPHVEITVNGSRTSTIDLYGSDFVLLTGPDGADWEQAVNSAGAVVPLRAHRLDAVAAQRHGVGPTGALLVRPDGFVAWREPAVTETEPKAALGRVLDAVLARAQAG